MIETLDIRTAELVSYVVEILRRSDTHVTSADVHVRPSPYASSCDLYEVDVQIDGGTRAMMLKDLSASAQIAAAIGIRPQHLYDPVRELSVYQRILDAEGIGPRLVGTCIIRSESRYLLLVERLSGSALDLHGAFDVWERAAHAIGAMHARFVEHPLSPRQRRHLLRIDGDDFRFWLQRAVERATLNGRDRAHAALADYGEGLAGEFERLPASFIHGELFASNIIVDDTTRVNPIDWELAAIGPGVVDIAALSSGAWSQDERAKLVDAYAAGLGDAGGAREVLDRSVELARLYLALRLIGWSNNWSPPVDEQQDWYAAALDAIGRLTS